MPDIFSNSVILMAVAVASVWLFKRFRLPPILAYLVCGMLAGPHTMGLFEQPESIHVFAELGIVFLLFSLGLEFSLPKMLAMRHWVFGMGLGQTLMTGGVFALGAMALGMDGASAFVIGSMAALSSTAVVIKQASELGIVNTPRAQMAISILLFQDLAVVPILILIPLLADGGDHSLALAVALALLKGALVFVILLSAGKWVLPRVFSEVARTRTDELFVLTTILVTLLAAGLTHAFGLSMALGAFLAGMMLGESQYRHQLEADIRPFRDILMGLFFITVGMRLDLPVLATQVHWVVLGVVVLMLGKLVLIRAAAWMFKAAKTDSWAAGVKLCQMGEFSFVIASLAVSHELLSPQLASTLLAIGVISMAITPLLVDNSLRIAKVFVRQPSPQAIPSELLAQQSKQLGNHVLIFGYGRVGQSVARLLQTEAISYLAIDADPIRVQESRSAGHPVFFGDVSQKDILRAAGVETAKLALLTFDEHNKALEVIKTVKALNPELPVVVRTHKDYHLEELYAEGATQVVPEILEGSLMLVSQVLHLSGVPMSRILKRVRKERKGHYGHMHGFFPGETTEISSGTQDKLEFMHAVVLTHDAWAVGKTLDEINISGMRVVLKGLRRDSVEMAEPDQHLPLRPDDVLVIAGKPRRVERVERHLLEGD